MKRIIRKSTEADKWQYSYDQLLEITKKSREFVFGEQLSIENIESVLLALVELDYIEEVFKNEM